MNGVLALQRQCEVHYDVELTQRPPASLLSRYPSATVRTTGVQTALRRRVEGPAQLGALLSDLRSAGLVLTAVHRLPPTHEPDAATYEVRVAGELGAGLVSCLHCTHYEVPAQAVVRLAAAGAELNQFLQECTDYGARIERVRRVETTP